MRRYIKFLLLFGFLFIFSKNETQAQTFQAGIIAGVNLSQLNGDDLAGFNQIGLNFGGRVVVDFGEKWRWNLDILLSQKGSNKGKDDSPSTPIDTYRLNYAEVPFMVSYKDWLDDSGDTEFYKMHFTTGFSVGRLVDFKVVDFVGQDISDLQDFKRTAVDLIIGATYYINEHIGINGQYSFALLDVRAIKEQQSLAGRTLTFRGIYMF